MNREFVWVEKYRPTKIDDCILPDSMKETFKAFISSGNVPNLLLSGPPGTGKTTVAKAMLEEMESDYIVINGSMSGNIDTLRNEITEFASTVSFTQGRKYVIIDEADYLNANSTQPALRNFMEQYSNNCGFIFTCNFPNRIIAPLHGRMAAIEFKYPKSDAPKLAATFFKRICYILDAENIKYDKKVIAQFINKFYPDFRRTINELQRYSINSSNTIDSGILLSVSDENFKLLMDLLKNRKWNEMRAWVAENYDSEPAALMRKIYDDASEYMQSGCIPEIVVITAKYSYQNAFVTDGEINLVAMLTEIMMAAQWK